MRSSVRCTLCMTNDDVQIAGGPVFGAAVWREGESSTIFLRIFQNRGCYERQIRPLFLFSQENSSYDMYCAACPTWDECGNCTIANPNTAELCETVPPHTTSADADGTLQSLVLDEGYWRTSTSSVEILECYNKGACVGGSQDYCAAGYTGPCERTKALRTVPLCATSATVEVLKKHGPRRVARSFCQSAVNQRSSRLLQTSVILGLTVRNLVISHILACDAAAPCRLTRLLFLVSSSPCKSLYLPDCAVCDEGYAPGMAYSCHQCSKGRTSLALALAAIVSLAVLAVLVVIGRKLMFGTAMTPHDARLATSSWCQRIRQAIPYQAVKILIMVWQIVTQVRTFPLPPQPF